MEIVQLTLCFGNVKKQKLNDLLIVESRYGS